MEKEECNDPTEYRRPHDAPDTNEPAGNTIHNGRQNH